LVVGFASGIEVEEVPIVNGRTLCFGNFSLVGVVLSYQDPTLTPAGLGYNPMPPEVGNQVQAHLVELLRAGQIRPVIGKVVPFEQLPSALEEMEARSTVGRTVVTWH
jgi:NADPH2:quinone reductase